MRTYEVLTLLIATASLVVTAIVGIVVIVGTLHK